MLHQTARTYTGVLYSVAKIFAGPGMFFEHQVKAPMKENTLPPEAISETLLRLPAVLQRFPVSRSKFLQGVKDGIYPKPVTITPRCVAWRDSDIRSLISSL